MSGTLYLLNGGTTLYPALSADELYRTTPDPLTDQFTANALSPQNSIVSADLWGKGYAYLYQANACLEGIAQSAGISTGTKQRLRGEMLFTRSLCFFYLVQLFGEVPLTLTSDYAQNAKLPRTDTEVIYTQVVRDLQEAKEGLRNTAPLSTRPSYDACASLLARVYLYQKNWAGAAAEADTVISSGLYRLEDLADVFLTGSRETIFALSPVIPGINTAEGLNFIPYDAAQVPLYAITDSLRLSFEPGDARKSAWLGKAEVNGQTYYYPYKYKLRGSDVATENNVVLRLAELYLVRAEARAQLGEPDNAIEDLNVIRGRARLAPIPKGIAAAGVLPAIQHERRIELFVEWGHRWMDLTRSGQADAVLSREKSGWSGTDVLYPVPYSEILLNPALVQNPGY